MEQRLDNPTLLVSQLFCTDQSARCELRFSFVTWRADTPYTSCTTPLSQTKDNALSNVASGSHCAKTQIPCIKYQKKIRTAPSYDDVAAKGPSQRNGIQRNDTWISLNLYISYLNFYHHSKERLAKNSLWNLRSKRNKIQVNQFRTVRTGLRLDTSSSKKNDCANHN